MVTGFARKKRSSGRHLDLFTTSQVGKLLDISASDVRRLVHKCHLRLRREGRSLLLGFREIAFLREILRLQPHIRSTEQFRATVRLLKARVLGEGDAGVRVRVKAEGLVAEEERFTWDYVTGQLLLPFPESRDPSKDQKPRVSSLDARRTRKEFEEEDPAEKWYLLAIAREEAGDLGGARQAYLAALKCDPQLSDACVNLGRLAHYDGHLQRAMHWYQKALDIAPEDPIAHYNLAIALEDLEQIPEAIREYQRALDCDWEFPEAHFNLSRLLRALGQQLAAMRHLKIYRQLTGASR